MIAFKIAIMSTKLKLLQLQIQDEEEEDQLGLLFWSSSRRKCREDRDAGGCYGYRGGHGYRDATSMGVNQDKPGLLVYPGLLSTDSSRILIGEPIFPHKTSPSE